MAKKKRKRLASLHDQHHQAIHTYITKQIEGEDVPGQLHSMPESQPWHATTTWCWCHPKNTFTHPISGTTIWVHNRPIH